MPGGRVTALPCADPVKSTKYNDVSVADEQPRAVVVGRPVRAEQRVDRLRGSRLPGERQWQLATRAFARVLGVSERLVGQTGADPVLVDGEPGAPGELVAPADDPRRTRLRALSSPSRAARGPRPGWRRRAAAHRGRRATQPPGGTRRLTLSSAPPRPIVLSRRLYPLDPSRKGAAPAAATGLPFGYANPRPAAHHRVGPGPARRPALPLPASAKSISSSNLKNLSNTLNKGKHLTYYAAVHGAQQRPEVDGHPRAGTTEVVFRRRRAAR